MQPEWKGYCGTGDLKAEENDIQVSLDTGRRQCVRVEELADAFHLISLVATKSAVDTLMDASIRAWQRNRSVTLVGFRVDHIRSLPPRERGRTWCPGCPSSGWSSLPVYWQRLPSRSRESTSSRAWGTPLAP